MYVIRNAENGSVIGNTDKPLYIRKNKKNGCYVGATEEQAEGIAFRSKPYALLGKTGVDGPAVVLGQADAGEAIGDAAAAEAQNRADIAYIAMETGVEL